MKVKSGFEMEYQAYKDKNTDPYGGEVVRYTEAWADLMEAELVKGRGIPDVAKETSHTADTRGITGFMHGCAVQALARYWEYGEELRRWHNLGAQIKSEGEQANETGGVLNPAVLIIGE